MIISHSYRFIFLKINKTAGTSIEIALSKFCGPKDIITPISPEDEEIRKDLGYRGPQNHLLPFSSYSFADVKQLFKTHKRKNQYYNHIPAWKLRKFIPPSIWNNYFKFCFERNPWDRLISLYYWFCRSAPRPSISEFLTTKHPLILKRNGYEVYTENDQVVVDRVCYYERLKEELEAIRQLLGLPEKIVLPRAKSQFRKDRRNYRDVLTERERSTIAKMFNKEIRLLGYHY